MRMDPASQTDGLVVAGATATSRSTEPPQSQPSPPTSHVLQRAIVIERLRVFYVPVPKAGCTALLWSLAGLARLPESLFADSPGREVTRSLTIHDMSRWPEYFRFGERSPEDRRRILEADDWFRFTVVRHPYARLWSAWQSKILLAEPQFIEKFATQTWFPPPARSAAEIIDSFREFLAALEKDPGLVHADVHWAPQFDLIEYPQISYEHVGQVKKLGETLNRLREHLGDTKGFSIPALPHTNVSALPYTVELFTDADTRFLADVYADDMRTFGYEPHLRDAPGNAVPGEWTSTVETVTPALEELRQRNERVADMYGVVRTRRQEVREIKREKRREEKLRREEHRRNQRLQRRLRQQTNQLKQARNQVRHMRNSRTWRYTAPLRKVGAGLRRVKRSVRERR